MGIEWYIACPVHKKNVYSSRNGIYECLDTLRFLEKHRDCDIFIYPDHSGCGDNYTADDLSDEKISIRDIDEVKKLLTRL